jgi:catechol 2,3-dioxygenase-like lactoylglutathione lyase family enzyme
MKPRALDHVALWVADREPLASFLCDHLGMHEIERTDRFTLVGADARRGKLTLFVADGPREPGVLKRVVLRVADLDRALGSLPGGLDVGRPSPELATFEAPEGLGLGLTAAGNGKSEGHVDYDIDHVVLSVPEPARTSKGLADLGFELDGERLTVADKHLRLERNESRDGGRPLLNHLALLVDSADALRTEAERRGVEIAEVVDAANTLAVFVWGPDRIKLEFIEHKASFSLA